MNNFDPRTLARDPLVGAILGSLIALKFVPGLTWRQRAVNAAAGVLLSVVFGPWISELFSLVQTAQFALAGALAMFGLNIAIRLQSDLDKTSILEILKGYLPKGSKGKEE